MKTKMQTYLFILTLLCSSAFVAKPMAAQDLSEICPIVCAQSTTATTTFAGADTGVFLSLGWSNQKNGNAIDPFCVTCQSCKATFNFALYKPPGVVGTYTPSTNGNPGMGGVYSDAQVGTPTDPVTGSSRKQLDCGGSWNLDIHLEDPANGGTVDGNATFNCADC
jgi:hypothetical protein